MQISSSDKLFMGLFAFSGNQATKKDIGVAKNYLTENELQNLNMLVSGCFDIAELRAVRHIPTTIQDFIEQLDQVLAITDPPVLNGSGKRSHKQAMAKAEEEYRKYQNKTLSPVEEEYFKQLAAVERDLSKRSYSDSAEND